MAEMTWVEEHGINAHQAVKRVPDRVTHGYVHLYAAKRHQGDGGDLAIVARFPDGNVRANRFEDIEEAVNEGSPL